MRKLKICILTSTFPRFKDDNYGIFIYNNAIALAEAGMEVHIITPSTKGSKSFEILNDVNVNRFRYWYPEKYQKVAYGYSIPQNLRMSSLAKIQLPFFLISFLWKSLLITRKCDVIHAQWIPSAFPGLIARKFFGIPVALSIRGTDIRFFAKGIFMRKITKYILDNVNQIISLAPGESMLARKLGNYNIIEMHNPLDGERYNPNIPIEKFKKEFQLNNDLIVSFIARFYPQNKLYKMSNL